jgi:hypothetical protein
MKMKHILKTKLFMTSLFFLALGTISFVIQNLFYGYIDENGILHDSFFLPLSIISLLLGGVILFFSIIWFYLKKQ